MHDSVLLNVKWDNRTFDSVNIQLQSIFTEVFFINFYPNLRMKIWLPNFVKKISMSSSSTSTSSSSSSSSSLSWRLFSSKINPGYRRLLPRGSLGALRLGGTRASPVNPRDPSISHVYSTEHANGRAQLPHLKNPVQSTSCRFVIHENGNWNKFLNTVCCSWC